jgi:hypothetical protein
MKKIKKFLFFVIAIFFIFTLQGCNSTEITYYKDLNNKRFEILEDSFLFLWSSANYDIDVPENLLVFQVSLLLWKII